MKSKKEVQHLIDEWTHRCIDFIQNGGKGEVGKRISASDRKVIYEQVGEKCPTCPTEMIPTEKGRIPRKGEGRHPSSFTIEHVVPRTLGGNNKRDNLVAMCHQCNLYRNATMTVSIPTHTEMHGKSLSGGEITQVSRFIEWSIRTIHSPSSKKVDKMCSEIFENFIANAKKVKSPVVANKPVIIDTGKSSIDELVELLREINDTQKAILEQLQKSLFRRLFDFLVTPFRLLSRKIQSRSKISKSISTSKQKIFDTQPLENTFEETIEWLLLGKGPMPFSTFGHKLREYQKENNWENLGTNAFLEMHRIPKNSGLKKAILTKMPNRVSITGKSPKERIQMVNEKEVVEVKNNLEEPVQTILIEEGDNYPIDDSTNLDGIDMFRHECLRVINENESMSPSTFSKKLAASISKNGFEGRMTSKEFASHCGISKSWSLTKALRTHLSDSICVDGEGTTAIITPLPLQGNEIPIEDHGNEQVLNQVSTRVSIVENSKYTLITNLNSSKSGLKLPREPRVLAAILNWYVLNISKLTNFHELVNGVKGSGFVSSSRSFPIANQIRKAVFPPEMGKNSELDWNDAPHYDARELCDNMMNVSLEKEYDEYIFVVEPEFLVHAEEYFTNVKEFL